MTTLLVDEANLSVPDIEFDIHDDHDGGDIIISDIVSAQNKTIADAKKLQSTMQQRIDTLEEDKARMYISNRDLINSLNEIKRCAEWRLGLVKLMNDVSEQQEMVNELAEMIVGSVHTDGWISLRISEAEIEMFRDVTRESIAIGKRLRESAKAELQLIQQEINSVNTQVNLAEIADFDAIRAFQVENEKLQSELEKIKVQLQEAREHAREQSHQIVALQLGNELNESTRSIDSESTTELQRSLDHAKNTSIEREMRELVKAQLGMIQYEMETMIKEKDRDTLSLRRSISNLEEQKQRLSVEHDDEIKYLESSLSKPANEVRITDTIKVKDKVFTRSLLNSLIFILGLFAIPLFNVATAWVPDGLFITEPLSSVYWSRIIIGRSGSNQEQDVVQSWIVNLQNEIQSKQQLVGVLENSFDEQKSERDVMITEAKWANGFTNLFIGFSLSMMTMCAMTYISRKRPKQRRNHSYTSDVRGTLQKGVYYFNKWTH